MAENNDFTERCVLIIEPVSKRLNVARGRSVYDALVAMSFPVGAFCGGRGTCGKCKIRVVETETHLSPPTELEINKLGTQAIKDGFRLACQAVLQGDCRIYLTDALLPKGNRILVDSDMSHLGIKIEVKANPLVFSRHIVVPSASIEKPIADFSRLLDALAQDSDRSFLTNIDDVGYNLAKVIPNFLRQSNGSVTAYLHVSDNAKSPRLFDLVPGHKGDAIYGIAIDIGTTTIVGYLINVVSGEQVAISAMLNPQVAIGEDVVSRITYVVRNGAQSKAQALVVEALNEIIADACKKGGILPSDVRDIVVVGNTAMHHLFLGLDARYLAVSPFTPVFKAPANIRACQLGLTCNPNANVYMPPVIAGYVGTDTIGCIIASRIDMFDKYTLLIDIGTNGELVLGNKAGLITGSCAAGSALEGAQISFGMRAAEGSIEAVKIDPATLDPTLQVIGNTTPIGICGSGLVDITAEMLRARVITRSGKFNTKSEDIMKNPRITRIRDEYCYVLFDPAMDSHRIQGFDGKLNDSARTITVSQEDIRQIQLAKGAFLVGALLLLEKDGKKPSDIEQVILAGAFGSYINKENAMFIGLFPEVSIDHVYQIGNAAGMGAQVCLKDIGLRKIANEIAFTARYHEISAAPTFQVDYAHALYFPHYKLSYFPKIALQYEGIPER
ncbi:MAG: ASKHA domain-containing protein [Candidatus Sigynarchaeota archaeon]